MHATTIDSPSPPGSNAASPTVLRHLLHFLWPIFLTGTDQDRRHPPSSPSAMYRSRPPTVSSPTAGPIPTTGGRSRLRPLPHGGDVASATSPATSAPGLTWQATWQPHRTPYTSAETVPRQARG